MIRLAALISMLLSGSALAAQGSFCSDAFTFKQKMAEAGESVVAVWQEQEGITKLLFASPDGYTWTMAMFQDGSNVCTMRDGTYITIFKLIPEEQL